MQMKRIVYARKALGLPIWLMFFKLIEQNGEYERKSEFPGNPLVKMSSPRRSFSNAPPIGNLFEKGVDL